MMLMNAVLRSITLVDLMKQLLIQIKNLLLSKNILSINEIELVDKNIKEQIKKSVDFAEKSPYPNKEEVFTDIYVQKDYPFIKE